MPLPIEGLTGVVTLSKEKSDAELIREVAAGDRKSFAELESRLASSIYANAYQVLNNAHDAEEITQDILTQLWIRAGEFQERKGKLRTWVATITRNRAIDRLRSNRRRFRLREDFTRESAVFEAVKKEPSGYTVCAGNDEAESVRRAVAELSDPQRIAIELVYFKGMTQKEAAERLQQPVGTIKARVRRGVAKLRQVVPEML